jgi:thiamine pyrophosphate-dependent acetolactate synthase large subunit-like protein
VSTWTASTAFVALAHAFGWHGQRVESSRDLAPALESAFQQEGPSLVVIPSTIEKTSS